MDLQEGKEKARVHYDQEAEGYIHRYEEGYEKYPSNLMRLNIVIERLKKNNVKTVLDAGCGTCGPIMRFLKEGFQAKGFDFSQEMVKEGKKELEKNGYDPSLVFHADLDDPSSFPNEKFDAVIALGVFPHLLDEAKALGNIGGILNKNGLVFIEFRNDLFAAFSMNKYSRDFFLNRLINTSSLPKEIAEEAAMFYSERLNADKPEKRENSKVLYSDILATFRNPLTVGNELFKKNGFEVVNMLFYHYHALPPIFELKHPKLFRELSMKMENPHDWRGYFMASAYVVEARKMEGKYLKNEF